MTGAPATLFGNQRHSPGFRCRHLIRVSQLETLPDFGGIKARAFIC